jgi:hypothetical protein
MKNKIFNRIWYYILLSAYSGERFHDQRMRRRLCVHIPEITTLEFYTDEEIHWSLQVLTAASNGVLPCLQPAAWSQEVQVFREFCERVRRVNSMSFATSLASMNS